MNRKKVWVCIFLGFILFYLLIFNRFTANFLISHFLKNPKLTCDVRSFSLFFGIKIDSLKIYSMQNSFSDPILSLDKMELNYNLIYLLLGKIKIRDIILLNPKIFLEKKNNQWNYDTLVSKSDKVKKESENPIEELSIYIPFNFFFELNLLNGQFKISDTDSGFSAEVLNLNLKTKITTNRSNKIPLSLKILSLVDTFSLHLNSEKKIKTKIVDTKINFDNELDAKIVLEKNKQDPIYSEILLGGKDLNFQINQNRIANFSLGFEATISQKLESDKILLERLSLKIKDETWIKASGEINKYLSNNREYFFNLEETKINLDRLNIAFQIFPNLRDKEIFGIVKIMPTKFFGDLESFNIHSKLGMENFRFKIKSNIHSVPKLNLNLMANLNFEDTKTQIPFLQKLELDSQIFYNTMGLILKISYEKEKRLSANLNLSNLLLSQFINNISGKVNGKFDIQAVNLSFVKIKSELNANGIEYFIGQSKSAITNLSLNLVSDIGFLENFKIGKIGIKSLGLRILNKSFEEVSHLNSSAELNLNPSLSGALDKMDLQIQLNKLIPILPLYLKEKISPLKKILGEEQKLNGALSFSKSEKLTLDGNIDLSISGIDLVKSKLNFGIDYFHDELNIRKISLTAFQNILTANFFGTLNLNPKNKEETIFGIQPKLEGNITLNSKSSLPILAGFFFDGLFETKFKAENNILKANIESVNSNFFYSKGFCQEGDLKNCQLLKIYEVNLNLPITHIFTSVEAKTMIEGSKSKFISQPENLQKPNFTIKNIYTTLPLSSNKLVKIVQDINGNNGLNGSLIYNDNSFSIPKIEIKSFDGTFIGKNILFHLGNLDLEKIEYEGSIQIRDIDLKQLISERARESINDGKLKGDLNFSGNNLLDPLPNIKLYLSIFKIGEDFGKSAVRIVSTSNFFLDFMISSYSQIDKIQFELAKGLVYSDIIFKRAFIPTILISFKNNSIIQERIPLANFLNRAKKEIVNYE